MEPLIKLFENTFNKDIDEISKLSSHSSERKIFRIKSGRFTCIGIHNKNIEENIAFLQFSIALKAIQLKVPLIYSCLKNYEYYLEEDLGKFNLQEYISRRKFEVSNEKFLLYKNALNDLIDIQLKGDKVIDYKFCYQTSAFNKTQINLDLQKFYDFFTGNIIKYKFPKKVIDTLSHYFNKIISKDKKQYFMYRDFQPRNIMVRNRKLYYIDYQSGRKGPLQYDLASFLYSGSIKLTKFERKKLFGFYLNNLSERISIDKNHFSENFYIISAARLVQMLGSYGYSFSVTENKIFIKKTLKAFDRIEDIIPNIQDKFLKQFLEDLIDHKKMLSLIS
jgi:aminoglycoside/choline kinase family phosphotransferase